MKFTDVLDDLKVAVLSRCVSKLLQIKSPPLLLGENVLLKIVSDALIRTEEHVNMKLDHDLLPLLIEHLSETLFQDVTVLTGISLKGYLIPTKEEHFWQNCLCLGRPTNRIHTKTQIRTHAIDQKT